MTRAGAPASATLVRIVQATMGVDASLLGAAELAFEPLLPDPVLWVGRRDAVPELLSARPHRRAVGAKQSGICLEEDASVANSREETRR